MYFLFFIDNLIIKCTLGSKKFNALGQGYQSLLVSLFFVNYWFAWGSVIIIIKIIYLIRKTACMNGRCSIFWAALAASPGGQKQDFVVQFDSLAISSSIILGGACSPNILGLSLMILFFPSFLFSTPINTLWSLVLLVFRIQSFQFYFYILIIISFVKVL